jgi:hypothetical protein
MTFRALSSFPETATADDVVGLDLRTLGGILLRHLKSHEGQNKVYQNSRLNKGYLVAMLENRNIGLGTLPKEPEYGSRQPDVTKAVMEAWNWLEREGFLVPDFAVQGWHVISREGEQLISRLSRFEQWEKYGVDRIKHDLLNGGYRIVGGPAENQDLAWEWVRMKEGQTATAKAQVEKPVATGSLRFIAEERLNELRKLSSNEFDFRKLIRLCEELNSAFDDGCYLATAMLTRGVLDHVPPLFGKRTFAEVANNYGDGGKSFKEAMLHLENAARKVADAHLHTPIRKIESLPTAQQVWFASNLDLLLAELIRIMG